MLRKYSGWLFLFLVALAYGITAIFAPERAREAIGSFLPMLGEMLPALAMVFVLMFLIELFLNPERIDSWVGNRSGLRGWNDYEQPLVNEAGVLLDPDWPDAMFSAPIAPEKLGPVAASVLQA